MVGPGDAGKVFHQLKAIKPYAEKIFDLHFPHYNPSICASGRPVRPDVSQEQARKLTFEMIDWNMQNTGFTLTLLLNYLLHENYKVVVNNVFEEFYNRGVRSVVVADLELIKRLKDKMPDLEVQGSCISNRMTVEELEEERKEGVILHNPSVNIIRNPAQLKKNAAAGYAQKVIVFEGCLNHCPDENSQYGHRWFLARSLTKEDGFCSRMKIATDPRHFFKANWVTAQHFKKLMPYITVAKLPRSYHSMSYVLKTITDAVEKDEPYNVLDYIGAGYHRFLHRDVGFISSDLFDDDFFEKTQACSMDCEKRGCNICYTIMNQAKRQSYKQKRLAKRARRSSGSRQWYVDPFWQRQGSVAMI